MCVSTAIALSPKATFSTTFAVLRPTPGSTPREVEDGLVRKCPPELLRDAHHWLILHGRYICKARMPECWRCPAIAHCNYRDKVLAPPAR